MNVRIFSHPLSGELSAIPSKSDAHRALICAVLSGSTGLYKTLTQRLDTEHAGEDIQATIRCLNALQTAGDCTLDCGESGSTLRFLLPVAAALRDKTTLTGRGRLPQRPLGELRSQMEAHGVHFSAETLPFTIENRMTGGCYTLPGNVSSQYVSGLLLALPLLAEDSRICLTTPLESAAYVEMTLQTLRHFGIRIQTEADGFFVPGGQHYQAPADFMPEGDWSNASYFLTAGFFGGDVKITGLCKSSAQADRMIQHHLADFGALVETQDASIRVRPGNLPPDTRLQIDVSACPDLFPILAVAACGVCRETHLIHAARLRLKESDRISSTAAMIQALGGSVKEMPDALAIYGNGRLQGGSVQSAGDHRIVMSAAIASILCENPVKIDGAEAVRKSYPHFFEDFQQLGGITDGI